MEAQGSGLTNKYAEGYPKARWYGGCENVDIVENLSGKKVKVLSKEVGGPMQFRYDISLLKKLTGWNPRYSLEEGLTETYNIMKAYADECRWWEKDKDY